MLLTATTGERGDPSGAVIGWLLVALVAAAALAHERRLRRRGGTVEALALGALRAAEGPGFVEDGDVADERERVRRRVGGGAGGAGGAGGTDEGDADAAVVVSGLRKVYAPRGRAPPKVAVVDLSLRIGRAECFGFLGPNGAGKTTTLSILTGDYLPSTPAPGPGPNPSPNFNFTPNPTPTPNPYPYAYPYPGDYLPSAGRAWIDGCDVVSELRAVRRRLGYCPQQDPLLELMTGRETLLMFARLKNLPEARIGGLVAAMLRQTSLLPCADAVRGRAREG